MYRNYEEDKLSYLKMITEANLDPEKMSNLSNPVADIWNWDGKGELPTTLKSADMSAIIKKIASKEDGDLKKTEFFEMYDQIFGKGEKTAYSPYDSLGDYNYRETLIEDEIKNSDTMKRLKQALIEAEEQEAPEDENKDIKSSFQDLKNSELKSDESETEEDDDDDDEDDDDNLNESFMGLDLDEDSYEDNYVEESSKHESSPLSLLENNETDIMNLSTLLEQTQLIEDEVDSVLNYDNTFNEGLEEFSDVLTESDEISEDNFDEFMLAEGYDDSDLSDYLDEDIL